MCSAQKPVVTLDTYKRWNYANGGDLSADGKYALYNEVMPGEQKTVLHVKSTGGKIIFSRSGVTQAKFSSDSKYVITGITGDSLLIVNLGTNKRLVLANVSNYQLQKWKNAERVFVKSMNGDMQILDFTGKVLLAVPQVKEFELTQNGMAMAAIHKDNVTRNDNLIWIDSNTGKTLLVYSASGLSRLILDRSGSKVAFLPALDENKIGYYRTGMRSAEVIPIKSELKLRANRNWSFNGDGSRIVFSLMERQSIEKKNDDLNLEIWNYQDRYLQSYYYGKGDLGSNIEANVYLAILDVGTKKFVQLTKKDQRVMFGTLKLGKQDYCIVESNTYSMERNNRSTRSYHLCILNSGEMIPIKENVSTPVYRWNFSPSGKYVAYYDHKAKNYFCYDIAHRQNRNVTAKIKSGLDRYDKSHYSNPGNYPAGFLGWQKNDDGIIIQGTFDLWKVDPLASQEPINLTAGIGKETKIVFCPAMRSEWFGSDGEKILVTAFDTRSKDFGFYKVALNSDRKPQRLSMGQRYMEDVYLPLNTSILDISTGGYMVYMEQCDHGPNYYFSKDLITFKPVSNVRPELQWNWIKSELLNYKDSLGNELQGVLYKPENFDPSKKYPVIFGVYELQSNHLNFFYRPYMAGAMFTLPWMVSNGYLVFLPDIKGNPKHGGDGLTRCILAGADHLSTLPWVDTARMGIAGHSVGGFVTNYAITHTDRFKAAVSGAGISDMVRAATDLWGYGDSKQEFLKDAVYMMKVDLTDDVESYIRNSPILNAGKLKTPLLLMHNDQDGSVRFEQSRSFFMILRQLQKPCWWLNYRGQPHALLEEKQQIDYNIKVKGFFDHYLKDKPMPDWMKEHI